MAGLNKRGVVLFTVLAVIFIAVILTNVILALVSSHSRLTHHQVSRIQAFYAAQAGMNYALDQLRRGPSGTPAGWAVGSNCVAASPCTLTDSGFPSQVKSVSIVIKPYNAADPDCNNSPNQSACINVTVDYSYP